MSDVLLEDAPDALSEADLGAAGPIIEAAGTRMVIPKKGKLFDEDGVCEIVIIRPCVSRGKRIHGLPPIYTPKMLEANAGVYTGWLMYMDHLTERIVEALMKEGRSIRELGGRVLKSWWDPTVTFKDDADFGFQRGGVVARALPQEPVQKMLEKDPEILNVSHNAWPTGATKAAAPWDSNVKGYLIEGIRPRPEGSVDWVPRGGAGGRMRLSEQKEWEDFAVGVLGSYYSAPSREDDQVTDFNKMTEKELREKLLKENPSLAESLGVKAEAPPERITVASGGLTEAQLTEAVTAAVKPLQEKLTELESSVEEKVEERVSERLGEANTFTRLEEHASKLIKSAGLGARWTADLTRRYSVLPSGPSQVLQLAEGETLQEKLESLKTLVEADVQHARELIEEVGGVPVPAPGGKPKGAGVGERRHKRSSGAFREFMQESGGFGKDKDGKLIEVSDDTIKTMVTEGATL